MLLLRLSLWRDQGVLLLPIPLSRHLKPNEGGSTELWEPCSVSGPYLKISKGERLVIASLEVRALRGPQEQRALSVVEGGTRVAIGRPWSSF